MLKKSLAMFVAVAVLAGCHSQDTVSKPSMALFAEQEANVDPYQTRIIVDKHYMRMDDGAGGKDFVLLDRKAKMIYSINSDNKTIMTIKMRPVDIKPPIKLNMESNKVDSLKNAPSIDNKKPEHYAFSVNNKVCYEAVVVKGMLPDMVAAMKTFAKILAGDSAVTFKNIPADVQNACDMAGNTFAPTRHLDIGFPIQEWKKGYSRTLLKFNKDYKIEPKLFELPKGYYQFAVDDFRAGKVKIPE